MPAVEYAGKCPSNDPPMATTVLPSRIAIWLNSCPFISMRRDVIWVVSPSQDESEDRSLGDLLRAYPAGYRKVL